jgi:hypothetical protein
MTSIITGRDARAASGGAPPASLQKLRRAALAGLRLALIVGAAVGANGCEEEHHGHPVPYPYSDCRKLTSCEPCTLALGCGWCVDTSGRGQCADQPNACPGQQFSWTWEVSGCGTGTDAGRDAAPSDAGTDAASIAPAADAARD